MATVDPLLDTIKAMPQTLKGKTNGSRSLRRLRTAHGYHGRALP